jgi:hypothetical protein
MRCGRRTDGAGGRFSMLPTLWRKAVLRSTGRPCLRKINECLVSEGVPYVS